MRCAILVETRLEILGRTLAFHGPLQQGFKHWQQRLRFVKGEGFHLRIPIATEYDKMKQKYHRLRFKAIHTQANNARISK